jgi:membrane-associated protease RseP (regulator of RpoE activity)
MKTDWMQGLFAGIVAVLLSVVAYGQQSTPPPATDYAPAAPGATSASPVTDTAAPAAGVTSGAGAAEGALDDRPNEQSAEAASTGSTTTNSSGAFPPPMARPASPLDRQLGSGAGGGGTVAGQRGELGVWLVETGGAGVQIRRITEGSAAATAGLQPGDVILGINGRGANSPHTIAQMIRQIPAGQTATVQFWRDGQTNELQIALQPAREQYEVGFRGDDPMVSASRTSGDLESRTMRLEQQLAAVMQELRALRQEMAQLRGSGSSSTAIGGGVGEAATTTGFDAATSTGTTAPAATTTQPAATPPATTAPQPDPFGEATEPAAQPEAAPPATPAPAAEPAAGDDDVFGSATEEPAAEGAAPAEGEAAPAEGEAAPADSGSDNLFE